MRLHIGQNASWPVKTNLDYVSKITGQPMPKPRHAIQPTPNSQPLSMRSEPKLCFDM